MRKFYLNSFVCTVIACLSFTSLHAQDEPVAISNYEELEAIRANIGFIEMNGENEIFGIIGSYYLTNDIEIPEGTEWVPLGAMDAADGNPQQFAGTFDGKGFKITNLKINSTVNFKGLFGRLNGATVKDLGLEVDIIGGNPTGGLVGAMFGETLVERVHVTGRIEGSNEVGGIAGRAATHQSLNGFNTVRDCYVNATLVSNAGVQNNNARVGGIIGNVTGTASIENVIAAGEYEAPNLNADLHNVAGITSYVSNTAAKKAVFRLKNAVVVANKIEGATPNYFLCRGPQGEISVETENNYAADDITLAYLNEENKGKGAEGNAWWLAGDYTFFATTGRATLMTEDFYKTTLGWDFDNVWTMGSDYPILKIANPVGIKESARAQKSLIYTVNGGIRLSSSEVASITVTALTGQTVYVNQQLAPGHTVSLQKGIYLVKAVTAGNTISAKVVIK